MRFGSANLSAAVSDLEGELSTEAQDRDRKQYGRRRVVRAPKRRSTRSTGATAPIGMAGRRNRRWAW